MEVILSPGVLRLGFPVTVLLAVYHATPKEGPLNRLRVDGYIIWAHHHAGAVRFSLPHEVLTEERKEPGTNPPTQAAGHDRDPLDQVIETHEVHQARTFSELQRLTLEIAREKGRITADDIRQRVEVPGDRRIIGAALAKLCRDGWLTPVDYVATRVKTSHHRPIRVFLYNRKPPTAVGETSGG